MAGQRALEPGKLVHGYYRIEKTLGEGGFGVTYLVTDTRDGRKYAMKEFFPDKMAFRDPKSDIVLPKKEYTDSFNRFRQQFLDEARLIYKYRDHPGIIDVHKLFSGNNTAYYVMGYLDGGDLKSKIKSNGGTLPWNFLRPVLEQIVSALALIHRDGVTHCDISPDNIFVLNNGSAKLIDFGAAKSSLGSQNNEVFLKRGFAPPEQTRANGNIGPWSDIYALAVTIYYAYTGKMPPTSVDRQIDDRTVWPSQMGIPLPSDNWEYALRRAMAMRVEDRYHTVQEFWRDLAGPPPGSGLVLEGVQGHCRGTRIPVNGTVVFGRDPAKCTVVFPPTAPGVSSRHMCVWNENGSLYAMDLNSTYGTWLGNNKMKPGLCYSLRPEDTLFFGANQMLRVARAEADSTRTGYKKFTTQII